MRNNDISIRAFVPETDTLALSRIWLDASLIAHAFIGEQRLLELQMLIETQYLPGAESWVACIGDAPAGFISLLDTFVGAFSSHRSGRGWASVTS